MPNIQCGLKDPIGKRGAITFLQRSCLWVWIRKAKEKLCVCLNWIRELFFRVVSTYNLYVDSKTICWVCRDQNSKRKIITRIKQDNQIRFGKICLGEFLNKTKVY